ncbi:L,D-transpeptidase family protein [Alkalihalobacillus sp. BA299]|uniref:L,D-transpeptidase family protein n=1 Tax=Alkalihalobacillus sp. BA299 TaxID=2815938 RepID=UPI001ADD1150|nr:L,D-transpeptidase family protein [Alkalihalobacillus sp. BA299]
MRFLYILFFTFLISAFILPSSGHAIDESMPYIHVDLWKNELYLLNGHKVVKSFSISPGTDHKQTPIGHFKVIYKAKNWGGGFGTRWLGLNVPWGDFGIHGTNKPWLVGTKVSSGCIRMKNSDVEELYELVPVGTPVHINGPIMGSGDAEYKRLSKNSKGVLVYLVQMRLKAAGYYDEDVNGIFDSKTERAVKEFQKDEGIPITGGISKRDYIHLGLLE